MILLQRTRYLMDSNEPGVCHKTELNEPFRPIRIPVNATFNGEFYLGTSSIPGAGVLVESWSGNTTVGNNYNIHVSI